ncbi:hypothetical protein H6P81_020153 [Aristolochia fimbriata]|uniref:Uncharacterized protein n=1 Tax=Aristolochia fimbriata TaxID=158543 RepID=A0AAV7DTS0_ARIFI|nr:hypothetical protein H6P81_020153 [Aristolochia fimbriata]
MDWSNEVKVVGGILGNAAARWDDVSLSRALRFIRFTEKRRRRNGERERDHNVCPRERRRRRKTKTGVMERARIGGCVRRPHAAVFQSPFVLTHEYRVHLVRPMV